MNDMDLFIAKTQRQLAFFLIGILVLLVLIVCGVLLIPSLHANEQITGLLIQVVTGVLALAGTAVGYFFARHRPPTAADEDSTPTQAAGKTAPLVPQTPEKKP